MKTKWKCTIDCMGRWYIYTPRLLSENSMPTSNKCIYFYYNLNQMHLKSREKKIFQPFGSVFVVVIIIVSVVCCFLHFVRSFVRLLLFFSHLVYFAFLRRFTSLFSVRAGNFVGTLFAKGLTNRFLCFSTHIFCTNLFDSLSTLRCLLRQIVLQCYACYVYK